MFSTCLNEQPFWILLPLFIGSLYIFKNSILLLQWIFITFFRPTKNLKKTYGSWAVITGATDGIGKAFAFQLAQRGLNLILVGRNLQKLEQVSSSIRGRFPFTEIKFVVIEGLDVGILINNVGVTYPSARFFHEVNEEVWMNVVRVNIKGTTFITKSVLSRMVSRKQRGAIVNLGSGASIVVPSHPLYAIYAATKAYVDQLSRSLYVEYKERGIDVQCQVPLYVSTKMASRVALIEKSSFFVPSAEDYAQAAVRRLGYESRCTPWWTHSLQWTFASILPESILDGWRFSIGIHRRKASLLTSN
ncbi:hypothetical protein M9H77_10259 [Catharanthus roseus]|uniref:Uncharacterized protein n=1 Tax=Catharanthus roseus TaxID=4058 RepID=A0ACC0C2Y1_CATRO|nr:hypothetical protein M9H77_10259 [Catharanthus roseus]